VSGLEKLEKSLSQERTKEKKKTKSFPRKTNLEKTTGVSYK